MHAHTNAARVPPPRAGQRTRCGRPPLLLKAAAFRSQAFTMFYHVSSQTRGKAFPRSAEIAPFPGSQTADTAIPSGEGERADPLLRRLSPSLTPVRQSPAPPCVPIFARFPLCPFSLPYPAGRPVPSLPARWEARRDGTDGRRSAGRPAPRPPSEPSRFAARGRASSAPRRAASGFRRAAGAGWALTGRRRRGQLPPPRVGQERRSLASPEISAEKYGARRPRLGACCDTVWGGLGTNPKNEVKYRKLSNRHTRMCFSQSLLLAFRAAA